MLTLKYGGDVGGISHRSAHIPYGIEVYFKTLLVYITKNFLTFQIVGVEIYFKQFWKVFDKSNMNLNKESENKHFSCCLKAEKCTFLRRCPNHASQNK